RLIAFAPAGLSATGYSKSVGARQGEFFILVCACCAADADPADDFSVDNDWNSADQWCESIDGGHGRAAFVDQLLKKACRFFEKHCRTCFAYRDGCAHREGSIEPFECH